jgi:hypothetical protein
MLFLCKIVFMALHFNTPAQGRFWQLFARGILALPVENKLMSRAI